VGQFLHVGIDFFTSSVRNTKLHCTTHMFTQRLNFYFYSTAINLERNFAISFNLLLTSGSCFLNNRNIVPRRVLKFFKFPGTTMVPGSVFYLHIFSCPTTNGLLLQAVHGQPSLRRPHHICLSFRLPRSAQCAQIFIHAHLRVCHTDRIYTVRPVATAICLTPNLF